MEETKIHLAACLEPYDLNTYLLAKKSNLIDPPLVSMEIRNDKYSSYNIDFIYCSLEQGLMSYFENYKRIVNRIQLAPIIKDLPISVMDKDIIEDILNESFGILSDKLLDRCENIKDGVVNVMVTPSMLGSLSLEFKNIYLDTYKYYYAKKLFTEVYYIRYNYKEEKMVEKE